MDSVDTIPSSISILNRFAVFPAAVTHRLHLLSSHDQYRSPKPVLPTSDTVQPSIASNNTLLDLLRDKY